MSIFIDPVTGCTSLDDSQAARLLVAGGVEDLKFTSGQLRSLLHEATHHASLIGKVGCAYAALCLSGTGAVPTGRKAAGAGAISLQTRDWLIHHFCTAYYGPLLEGLALFAEYDLYSNAVPVESAPLHHAKALYLQRADREAVRAATQLLHQLVDSAGAAGWLDEIRRRREKHFNGVLLGHRLTADAKAMKAKLLSQPLIRPPEGAGLYLLGYLAIKGLYRMSRRYSPFRMTTLFHLALQQELFSDDMVARKLVAFNDLDGLSVQFTLNEIKERVQDIVEDLVFKPAAALARLSSIEHAAMTELDMHLQMMCGMRTALSGAPAWGPNYIGTRHVFRHASTAVRFVHEDDVTIVLSMDGAHLGSCARVSGSDLETAGSIELVQTPHLEHQALVVLTTHGLVAVRCLRSGEWNRPEQVAIFTKLPSAVPALALMSGRALPRVMEDGHDADLAELLAKVAESNEEFRTHVLTNMAFSMRDERRDRERARDVLAPAGFAGVFPEAELLELAEYSLVFGGEGLPIAEGAALVGRTETGCRRRLVAFNERASETLGISLFDVADDCVIAFV